MSAIDRIARLIDGCQGRIFNQQMPKLEKSLLLIFKFCQNNDHTLQFILPAAALV
jgi:hypothetical protein